MKESTKPSVDFNALLDDFRNLNLKDVGAWPVVLRVTILFVLFAAVLLAGWWFVWSDQLDALAARQQDELKLKEEYVAKRSRRSILTCILSN